MVQRVSWYFFSASPCSRLAQPDPFAGCRLPWARPSTRFYYDLSAGDCRSFQYPGCDVEGDSNGGINRFGSYAECMDSCLAQGSFTPSGGECGASGCFIPEQMNPYGRGDYPPGSLSCMSRVVFFFSSQIRRNPRQPWCPATTRPCSRAWAAPSFRPASSATASVTVHMEKTN